MDVWRRFWTVVCLLATLCWLVAESKIVIPYRYHNYNEMQALLVNMTNTRPDLATLYSIGKSVQGRDMWVMMLTAQHTETQLLKPNLKYVANMHGNEQVGKEMLLHLIAYIINGYDRDPQMRWFLENSIIHILPSMNPDGMEHSREGECAGRRGRENANNFDLNRNFPEVVGTSPRPPTEQPETAAIRKWLHLIPFVLSGSLHGGAMLVRYPFDNGIEYRVNAAPDHDVLMHLAKTYSLNHPVMHRGIQCDAEDHRRFKDGVVNGAEWYPFTGSMSDYNYVQEGCMELTLEISCCKYPPAHTLRQFWLENIKPLIRLMEEVHRGVKGIVKDTDGNPIATARLTIKNRDEVSFKTSPQGEFWRILLPGKYVLETTAPGFTTLETPFSIIDGHSAVLNITLTPIQPDIEQNYITPQSGRGPYSGRALSDNAPQQPYQQPPVQLEQQRIQPQFTAPLQTQAAALAPSPITYSQPNRPPVPIVPVPQYRLRAQVAPPVAAPPQPQYVNQAQPQFHQAGVQYQTQQQVFPQQATAEIKFSNIQQGAAGGLTFPANFQQPQQLVSQVNSGFGQAVSLPQAFGVSAETNSHLQRQRLVGNLGNLDTASSQESLVTFDTQNQPTAFQHPFKSPFAPTAALTLGGGIKPAPQSAFPPQVYKPTKDLTFVEDPDPPIETLTGAESWLADQESHRLPFGDNTRHGGILDHLFGPSGTRPEGLFGKRFSLQKRNDPVRQSSSSKS